MIVSIKATQSLLSPTHPRWPGTRQIRSPLPVRCKSARWEFAKRLQTRSIRQRISRSTQIPCFYRGAKVKRSASPTTATRMSMCNGLASLGVRPQSSCIMSTSRMQISNQSPALRCTHTLPQLFRVSKEWALEYRTYIKITQWSHSTVLSNRLRLGLFLFRIQMPLQRHSKLSSSTSPNTVDLLTKWQSLQNLPSSINRTLRLILSSLTRSLSMTLPRSN